MQQTDASEGNATSTFKVPILEAKGVTRVFGNGTNALTVLKGIDFAIMPGTLVAFKGRSGSGKTTLMNILATLDRPTAGAVRFLGRDLNECSDLDCDRIRRTDIGLIFQSSALMPMMNALENVDFSLRIAGVSERQRNAMAIWALEQVGLKKRMMHQPSELSGGEQQRVAIARAIAPRPKLILADEPTAELDSKTAVHVVQLLKELVRDTGLTVVMTTHDPIIMDMMDVVYELEDGYFVNQK